MDSKVFAIIVTKAENGWFIGWEERPDSGLKATREQCCITSELESGLIQAGKSIAAMMKNKGSV
jgi:hypothetical protein